MSTKDPIYRRFNLLGFILCLSALLYAVTSLQNPTTHISSPLISISKLLILSSSLIFFIALVHNPKTFGQRFYGLLNFFLSMSGLFLSAYHLWKQTKDSPPLELCSLSIESLSLQKTHFTDKASELVIAAIQCPVEPLNLIGLGAAEQCLILFVTLFLISWKVLIRRKKNEGLFL